MLLNIATLVNEKRSILFFKMHYTIEYLENIKSAQRKKWKASVNPPSRVPGPFSNSDSEWISKQKGATRGRNSSETGWSQMPDIWSEDWFPLETVTLHPLLTTNYFYPIIQPLSTIPFSRTAISRPSQLPMRYKKMSVLVNLILMFPGLGTVLLQICCWK